MTGRVSQGRSNESREGGREGGRDCGMGIWERVGVARREGKGWERNEQKAITELRRQSL